MNGRRLLVILLLACVVIVCCEAVGMACPTCKDGMGNDPDRANLVRGYFWSIIFMMSMPFLILTGISCYFYYEIRKARLAQAVEPTTHGMVPEV